MKYTEHTIKGTMYREPDTTFRFQDFDSLSEFNAYLEEAKPNRHFQGKSLDSQSGGYSFTGTRSYKEAQDLLANGWKVAAERIAKKVPVQTSQSQSKRSVPTYNVVGGQASVPRYLQGIPTNMVDRKMVQQKQKIVVINKAINASAAVSSEEIEEEGIKALQIIQALENKGYRVRLNMHMFALERGSTFNEIIGMRICIKKPDERLSLLKVAFPIAHPSMLRRIAFNWIETMPTATRNFSGGYGSPVGHRIKDIVPKTEILIPDYIPSVDEYIKNLGL